MKKIAILNCLHANQVCTGASCLQALEQRQRAFEPYAGEEIQLVAFLRCSQCGVLPQDDPGMTEKLERLQSIGTEIVHIGICAYKHSEKQVCPYMRAHAHWLEDHGIQVRWGTHSLFPAASQQKRSP